MNLQSNEAAIDGLADEIPAENAGVTNKNQGLEHLAKDVWSKIKYHLSSSTGVVTVGVPFFSSMETGIVGMPYLDSLNTRLSSVVAVYSGLGLIYAGGRKKFKKFLGVDENSLKGASNAADLAYGAIFNGVAQPFFYSAETLLRGRHIDPSILFHQMGLGLSMGSLGGVFVGWGIDVYNDLYGSAKSKALPDPVRNLHKSLKISLATFLTAGSLFFSMNYLPKIIPSGGNYGKEPSIPYSIVEKTQNVDLSLQADMERARSNLEYKLNIK